MKTSDLLNYVFDCAISDRETLSDAYGGEGEHAIEARHDARKFRELRDKLIPGRKSENGPGGLKRTLARLDREGEIQKVGLDELRELSRQNDY